MSEEHEYAEITFEAKESRPPFRFKIGEGEGRKRWEERFELPALDDPGLPVELLDVAMIAISGKAEEQMGGEAFAVITGWLRANHPGLVRALNRHSQTAPILLGIVEQWAEHTGADPKASR